jgi:hypothetical protein
LSGPALTMNHRVVLAHGIGTSHDLPIPARYALLGAAVALTVSFVVLGIAWRTSRFDGARSGRPLPRWLATAIDSPVTRTGMRSIGLAFTAYVVMAAVLGSDLLTNPTFGVVYVLLWIGLIVVSLLFGPVWTLISPVRTIHLLFARAVRSDPDRGVFEYPAWLGYWPAALGLFAFVWMELVESPVYLPPIRLWFGVYFAVMLVGSAVYGTRWFERADPFEVYSSLAARMSIWGRRTDGRLVVRNPLENLDSLPVTAGLVAVVAVLFGSTAFDTFKDTLTWTDYVQEHEFNRIVAGTTGLLVFIVAVGASYSLATMLAGGLGRIERRQMPGQLAHAVVPIVLGYVIAHYLSFLILQGQQTLIYLSDPLQRGWDVFGTANRGISYFIADAPGALAVVKVTSVITGHVLGVISSHDRAVRLLPRRHSLTGQVPLLVIMVLYTIGGLSLLLAT